MNTIFHEHMRKTVECYIDDIVVKSRTKGDHIANLKRVINIMWAHQPKMNPTNSFLEVEWQIPWVCCDIQRNQS